MKIIKTSPGSNLLLGRQGENNALELVFSLGPWIDEYGPGTVQLLHRRKGDQDPYPVTVTQENDVAKWLVSEADTSVAGDGEYQLHYYSGDTLVKSATGVSFVEGAMTSSVDPPDPYKGWVDKVSEAVSDANAAANRAAEAAKGSVKTVNGQEPDENGNVEIDIPDEVVGEAFVIHGDMVTVDKSNAEIYEAYLQKRPIYGVLNTENVDSIFYLAAIREDYALFVHEYPGYIVFVGYKGDEISVEEIPIGGSGEAFVIRLTEGGLDKTNAEIYEAFTQNRPMYVIAIGEQPVILHPVSVDKTNAVFSTNAGDVTLVLTYNNGEVSIESVEQGGGSGGADGFSPTANVRQTSTGAVITITDKTGTTTATVTNGKDGKDGKDGEAGYTPQKGIDYVDGQPGKDGTSATHKWNGTTLTITSASGTSSANLQGPAGDPGNSGVFVGSGDMPEDCNVQIDPDGESLSVDWLIDAVIEKLPIYNGEVVAV